MMLAIILVLEAIGADTINLSIMVEDMKTGFLFDGFVDLVIRAALKRDPLATAQAYENVLDFFSAQRI